MCVHVNLTANKVRQLKTILTWSSDDLVTNAKYVLMIITMVYLFGLFIV